MAHHASASASSLGTSLVPLVNKLQDIFAQAREPCVRALRFCAFLARADARACAACAQAGIPTGDLELPQVAVVGCQSSGKSSVLEALVRAALLRGRPERGWCPLGCRP
jgi:hypothetical protein